MWKLFCPDMYLKSIYELDAEILKNKGIRGIITDLDNTLVPWRGQNIYPQLEEWLKALKDQGFKLCIVSNNSPERGEKLARELGIPGVWYAVKPRRRAFRHAIEKMGIKPSETAVIGDQIFTDVLGGNRMGLFTILVLPMSRNEFVGTRATRLVERKVLKKLQKSGMIEAP